MLLGSGNLSVFVGWRCTEHHADDLVDDIFLRQFLHFFLSEMSDNLAKTKDTDLVRQGVGFPQFVSDENDRERSSSASSRKSDGQLESDASDEDEEDNHNSDDEKSSDDDELLNPRPRSNKRTKLGGFAGDDSDSDGY